MKSIAGSNVNNRAETAITLDGAILCGGLSRRMGRDKALLPVAGKSLLQHQLDLLCTSVGRLWVVSNRSYPVNLPDNGVMIKDYLPDSEGPLSGLLAAMRASDADYLWLMSCDNFGFQLSNLQSMLAQLQQGEADVVCWEVAGKVQPLLALIRTDLADALQAYMDSGERAVMRWYRDLNVKILKADQMMGFLNLNTEEDYQQLLNHCEQGLC